MSPAFISHAVRIVLALIAVCVQTALPLYAVRNRLDAEVGNTKKIVYILKK